MSRSNLVSLFKRPLGSGALAPERAGRRSQWLEVFLIPLMAIGIAWWSNPQDPLLSTSSFPWLWLAPVLIALRYGVMPGLLASVVVVLDWLVVEYLGLLLTDFSPTEFFGGGLLVLVCGEFSDVWRDRNQRMNEMNLYVTERLSRLTKRHLLLNLSHDRLEQEMLARPGSLRDALARLRAIGIAGGQSDSPLPGADALLQLLSQYVNIESAVLYTLQPGSGGPALGPERARLGEPEALAADDELLAMAIDKGQLAHIASKEVSLSRNTNQLVVAPLITGVDTLIGVLAVTRMPFFSLNVENLQLMFVILAYYADNIHNAPGVAQLKERLPVMPALYAEELIRMLYMQKKVGISSYIVVMSFEGARNEEIAADFLRVKRGIDLYWQSQVNGQPVIAVLMPFGSPAAAEGFVDRIEVWLQTRYGGTYDSLNIHLRMINFAQDDPVDVLASVMRG